MTFLLNFSSSKMNCNFGQRFYIQQNKNYKVNRNILEKMEKKTLRKVLPNILKTRKKIYIGMVACSWEVSILL